MVHLEHGRALPKEPAEQSQDSSDGLSVPSTQSLRHDIRKRIGRADQSTDRGTSSTPVSADDRSETVVKLQEAFEQGVPRDSSPEQRSRYAANLKNSEELLAQYQQVSQKIVALGPNADPNTLQDLHSRADLLIKRSAATLFHANTEQTIAGIEERQEHVTQLAERLTKEIKELEKLDESAPQRVAGLLELKKDQLQAFEDTGSALETIRLSLSDSLTKSDSFLKRAKELEKGEPVVSGQLAEANANMDSALLVLEDADGKTSLQAINTGLQHLEEAQLLEVERREQFVQSIANYDAQEQRLREACKTSLDRAQAGVNEAGIATEDIKQVTSSLIPFRSFISLVTGTTSAMEASRDNILSTAAEQNVTSGQLLDDLKNVKRAREEYIKWTHAGFEAERQGDIQKAQARFNQAALINEATADLGNPERILQTLTQPSINWRQRNREVTSKLAAAIASADKWEAGLEVARTVTVAAGATVATVATAGAGAGIFLSFVAGSGGGIAIGSASNFTEQGIGVATELKTAEQAKADFGRRFTQDAFTSVQAAGSTVTGLGAGRLFQSSSIASKLSPLGTRTLSGTIGGGASGATTTTIDIAQTLYRRNEAIADFNKSPEAQALSTEDRQAALDAHLSQQGLGLDDLAKRGIVNIGVSFVGGAVGANTGAFREAAKTNLGKISTVVLDTGADLTLGLGATLLTDGDISFEQGLAQSLQSVFVGNALSSLPARQIGVAEASAQPAKTKVNYLADAQSLRERFVSDSIDQLTATNGRSPTPDEVARITAESQSVRAYENPNTGEINVIKLNIESMDRFERVRYASDIVHELAHRRGGDEVIAHKAQFEYLLKNGYQPELRDGQLKIRALEAEESGTLPTDEQISDYVSRNYDSEESVGGMRLAKDKSEGEVTDDGKARPTEGSAHERSERETEIAKNRLEQGTLAPVETTRPVPIADQKLAAEKIAAITGGPPPPLGKPFLMSPEFIRWTQNSIDHRSRNGNYTVIDTADSLALRDHGGLKPNQLPALMIFVDTEGRIWSRDNRRLASAVLAGSPVNVQIMSASTISKDALRHFSTETDGRAVEVFHADTRERLGQVVNHGLVRHITETSPTETQALLGKLE